jgi:hypothetical protein
MTDPTEWPEYDVGPRESVFALGVASINYARLEFAFSGVFAKVLAKTNKEVWAVLPTLTNDKRLREMRKHLKVSNEEAYWDQVEQAGRGELTIRKKPGSAWGSFAAFPGGKGIRTAGPSRLIPEGGGAGGRRGPAVRIHLPPAASLQTFGSATPPPL